jgi:pimeloyl-ACP methyl ester carboxylesterase
MSEVELSAGTIEYDDTGGDGPVLVFLHGVAMDGSVWAPVVADLRRDHRCVVPTLPLGAHRRPMRRDADLSLRGFGRMTAELLERLGLEEVTLVQNDHGAVLALAGDDPRRVARLVVSSCEAFENYPPGLPGKNLRMAAMVPGGLFVAMQAMRLPACAARRLASAGWPSARYRTGWCTAGSGRRRPTPACGTTSPVTRATPAAAKCWRSATACGRSAARCSLSGHPRTACSAPTTAGGWRLSCQTRGSPRSPTTTPSSCGTSHKRSPARSASS